MWCWIFYTVITLFCIVVASKYIVLSFFPAVTYVAISILCCVTSLCYLVVWFLYLLILWSYIITVTSSCHSAGKFPNVCSSTFSPTLPIVSSCVWLSAVILITPSSSFRSCHLHGVRRFSHTPLPHPFRCHATRLLADEQAELPEGGNRLVADACVHV